MSFDAIHVVLLILLIASAVAAVVFMLKKASLVAQLDYLRDENRRLRAVERTGNIVDLFRRMDMDDATFVAWKEAQSPETNQPSEE